MHIVGKWHEPRWCAHDCKQPLLWAGFVWGALLFGEWPAGKIVHVPWSLFTHLGLFWYSPQLWAELVEDTLNIRKWKETCKRDLKRDLQKRPEKTPAKETWKESCKRDLKRDLQKRPEKRPAKETWKETCKRDLKRDLQKRPEKRPGKEITQTLYVREWAAGNIMHVPRSLLQISLLTHIHGSLFVGLFSYA